MRYELAMPKKKKINYDLGENIHDNVHRRRVNWFPGHMNKAIREIKEKLKQVDIVLEIRDARAPLTTGNTAFDEAVGQKNRLIIFNKTNLANSNRVELWKEWFSKQGTPFVFINGLDKKSVNQIIEKAKVIVHENILKSNPEYKGKKRFRMMIIGLPNTGKSTIINSLANRQATKAADKPGQTRHQLWVKVDDELELLDTPGIMPPKIAKYEHGLWLAAIHAVPKTIVDEEDSACFIVRFLMENKINAFKEKYQLESFDLELVDVLNQIGKLRGCLRHGGEYDYDRIYTLILADFRAGDLGAVSFGCPPEK